MRNFTLILIVFFTFFSCSKTQDYSTYNISVVDFDSNQPIAGAKVRLWVTGVNNRLIDSAITDVQGKVSFTTKEKAAGATAEKLNYLQASLSTYFFINR